MANGNQLPNEAKINILQSNEKKSKVKNHPIMQMLS